MNHRKIVRIQLMVLGVLVVLLVIRTLSGPPSPSGLVVFSDLETERLYHDAFEVRTASTFFVEGVGSREDPAVRSLAAYGWILRRDDRSVVWSMDRAGRRAVDGTLVEVADTLTLPPGSYDVYFATYGNRSQSWESRTFWNRVTGANRAWRSDERRWRLVLHASPEADRKAFGRSRAGIDAPHGGRLIWTSAPMRGRQTAERFFRVERPARLRLYAVGEIEETPMDYGWIENVETGERVWQMTMENTEPAGGWRVNRRFDGVVPLEPGIYRAVFETDPRQSFGDWVANPPFDPGAWGLSVYAEDDASVRHVSEFDPWRTSEPIVRITEVGNEEQHVSRLEVERPVQVLAYAVGEIGGSRYDYAWLADAESGERVWEMSREASQKAGGSEDNRLELAFLRLEPGTYTLGYETDDSHAYGDWRNGKPAHPERWGVTLFSLDGASGAVRVLGHDGERTPGPGDPPPRTRVERHPPPTPGPPPPALGRGAGVLRATGLGKEATRDMPFRLTEPTRLRVHAVGEISLSGRYDYGWIEQAETGETVWEMTWENTVPAGGDDRNRLFDGVLQLAPGPYVAHFRTDFSHHFGDFGDRAPDDPERWGITIEKLQAGR